MKKLLLIFLIAISLNSFSQTSNYIPFPTSQGDWTYRYFGDYGELTNEYYYFQLNGDTIINDSIYKKIYGENYFDEDWLDDGYLGAIREQSKVIYFIPDTSSTELVLYNFNLNIGDTIIHPFGGASCYDDTVYVYEIDSVLISNNYHKRISFEDGPAWIEGIGSIAYLLHPFEFLCVSGNLNLQCMMNDNQILWGESNSLCFVSVDEIEIPESDLSIYPNPSNSIFTINHKSGLIDQIFVSDNAGRIIIKMSDLNQHQVRIDKLPSGSYIVRIIDDRGRISINKLISSP